MRKKSLFTSILILFLILSFLGIFIQVPLVHATGITRVQGNARGTASSGSTISVTMNSTPTNGDLLIATIGIRQGHPDISVSNISESGVIWTVQVREDDWYDYSQISEIWAGVVGTSASASVTINLSGSIYSGHYAIADICEYSGLATSDFLDRNATSSYSYPPTTGTTTTTTQANELWVGITISYGDSQTSPTNGFTLLDGNYIYMISVAYLEKIVSSTGTANSGTSTTGSGVGCIATFATTAVTDTINPTYSGISTNTTLAGQPCSFNAQINDDRSLQNNGQYIFGTNNTGSWVNDTAINFTSTPQWANITSHTLNSTAGHTIHYEWWFTDNAGNKNNTGIQSTITSADTTLPIFGTITANNTVAGNPIQISCTISDNIAISSWGFAWNNTGSYVNSSKFSVSGTSITALYNGTWNSMVGYNISVQFWANDSSNNAAYSAVQTFTLTTTTGYMVDTLNDWMLTGWPSQWKMFYAHNLYWLFYGQSYGGGNIVFRTSSNRINWSSTTNIGVVNNGEGFSLWFSESLDKVYYVREYAGLNYRRGTPNSNGIITWDTAEISMSGGSYDRTAAITLNSTNYPWITTYRQDYDRVVVYMANDLAGTTWTMSNASAPGTAGSGGNSKPQWLLPLSNGRMFLIATKCSGGVPDYAYGYLWNGTGWVSNGQLPSSDIQLGEYASWAATVDSNDDIHYICINSSSPYELLYSKWSNNTQSWGTLQTIYTSTDASFEALAISCERSTGYIDVFLQTSNDQVGRLLYSNGWQTIDYPFGGQVVARYAFTTFIFAYSNRMALAWCETYTGTSYTLKFDSFTIPRIGEFQAPTEVYPNTYFLLNATIIDTDSNINLSNATLQISDDVTLLWVNSTNTFSIYSDPNSYCTLDATGSTRTTVNSTSYKLSWKIKLGSTYPSYSVNVISTNTKVFDCTDSYGSGSMTGLFTFMNTPLSITFANTTAIRIGIGSTFYVNGTILYNGTSIVPDAGTATIYASALGSVMGSTTSYNTTTGNFNFSVTSVNSIGNWTYTVYAMNSLGPSVVNQTLYIVSDKIIISLTPDTTAPTGGSTAHMNATASYAFDGSNVTTLGVTIIRNGTAYSYSTSWIDSEASGTVYNFTVSAANDTTYGLTAFSSNVLTIAWGQTVIEVSNIIQNSTRTGIGQAVQLNYQVIYGGNLTAVNSGNLIINGTNRAIVNGWANFTVTDSNITLNTYIASGSDINGTVFSQLPANPQIVFDEASIVLYFTSTSPQAGQNIVITWTITRLYDNSTVSNYNITINVNYAPVYQNITQAVSSITDSLSGTGSKTYSVGSFIDSDYNMTSYMNTPQTVSWSTIPQGGTWYNPIVQTSAVTYSVKVIVTNNLNPLINVQVVINGQISTTDTSGIALFTLAEGNYPITISGNGQLLYTSSIQITNSTASPQMIYIDIAPPSVIPTTINPVAIGIITIVAIIILALAASAFNQKETGKQWIRRQDRDSRKHVKQKSEKRKGIHK